MRPAGLPAKPRVTPPSAAAIGNLELAVLRRLDGLLQGDYAGLLPGPGSDTGEARPYVAGDDTRHIDWAVTARTTQPYVRDTIADRELELWLVVDASKSLDFGTARSEKREVVWAAVGSVRSARGPRRQPRRRPHDRFDSSSVPRSVDARPCGFDPHGAPSAH